MPSAERLWREVSNRLAREASVRVTATYLRYAQGAVTLEECVGIQGSLIAAAQRRAVTANDLILAAELTQRLDAEYAATGIEWYETAYQQTARLSRAASAVIGDDIAYLDAAAAGKTSEQVKQLTARSIRDRLVRLTDGETLGASHWARETAGGIWADQGVVTGWYRKPSPNACERCRKLGGPGPEDKYIHPVSHKFAIRHPRCTCFQAYWTGDLEPWQKFLGPRAQEKFFMEHE